MAKLNIPYMSSNGATGLFKRTISSFNSFSCSYQFHIGSTWGKEKSIHPGFSLYSCLPFHISLSSENSKTQSPIQEFHCIPLSTNFTDLSTLLLFCQQLIFCHTKLVTCLIVNHELQWSSPTDLWFSHQQFHVFFIFLTHSILQNETAPTGIPFSLSWQCYNFQMITW